MSTGRKETYEEIGRLLERANELWQQQRQEHDEETETSSVVTTIARTSNERIAEHRQLFSRSRTRSSSNNRIGPNTTTAITAGTATASRTSSPPRSVTTVGQGEAFNPLPFNPSLRPRNRNRRRRFSPYTFDRTETQKTFAKTIVVIPERNVNTVPTGAQRAQLINQGLWKEKVAVPSGGSLLSRYATM